jgi:YegS/Rv2252/BmrU family lipid kinase
MTAATDPAEIKGVSTRPMEQSLAAVPFLVVNPNSGGGATGRKWPKLEAEARRLLGNIAVGLTSRPLEAMELTKHALEAGHRTILAVGGDGTLNEVVNGFFRPDGTSIAPDAVVGLLPQGTGGDFRRTLGIPTAWTAALEHLAKAPVRRADVGRVRFRAHDGSEAVRHFFNVGSFGVSGAVDEEVNRSTNKWLGGRLAFMLASMRALSRWRDRRVRIIVDGGAAEEVSVTALALGNGQYFGGGMRVAPEAKVDDGIFHTTLWSRYGLWDFIFRQPGIYSGAHVTWDKTRCFTAKTLRAESDDRVLLDLDGEQPGTLPATFELLPGAIGLKG